MADQPTNITPLQTGAGLNLNLNPRNTKPGSLTYALNAVLQGVDGQGISYQDELGNNLWANYPDGYVPIGKKAIIELDLILLWLSNPKTGDSEIGKVVAGNYTALVNDKCLDFDVSRPIHKAFYRINKECGTEVYWTDGTQRKYINLDKLPFKEVPDPGGCGVVTTTEVDCNRMLVHPNFLIPQVQAVAVHSEGELVAGTYQFAVSYSAKNQESYTSYYSITNPIPIQDPTKVTLEYNYATNKAIEVAITGIDITSPFKYFNLAVIKTINNISSFELVGTYLIEKDSHIVLYTGQNIAKLSEGDIFEKFPIYTSAEDIYSVQGVLGWKGLTKPIRNSYQEIANAIHLQWQTYRIHKDSFKDPVKAAKYRGYMRDEVYPLEFVPLFTDGGQGDGFTIAARRPFPQDLEMVSGPDVLSESDTACDPLPETGQPRWKVYNTATILGYAPDYNSTDPCYEGPYQYGEFAYWESTEQYDCREPGLTGTIRHSKMPDEAVSPRYLSGDEEYVFPLGIKIDVQQVLDAIQSSSLPPEEKRRIAGFKIVRGNRAGGQKSVIAKGMLYNVGKYSQDGDDYYFPNYPYNDLNKDPFILTSQSGNDSGTNSQSWLDGFSTPESKERFTFHSPDTHFFQPALGSILKLESADWGKAEGHFVQVKNHAKYKFISLGSYLTALSVGVAVGFASLTVGVSSQPFDGAAAFTAFQVFLDIIEKVAPKINYCWQHNSVGKYTGTKPVDNAGSKQRKLNLSFYLEPGMVKRGEAHTINNYQRESALYLKTSGSLPFPHELQDVPQDKSRYLQSQGQPGITTQDISAFYASLKRNLPAQWGQLYSYETIDTGFQWLGDINRNLTDAGRYYTIFGGDTYINQFALKRKLPYFIDNRVGVVDGSDIDYRDMKNIGYPNYWFSTSSEQGSGGHLGFGQLFGVPQNNFDQPGHKFFYQTGKIYLFSYGIPYFFCESEVNVDMRQAFNDREGDFFPHVGDGIPDEWLQEIHSTIKQDNTYHYNKSYSKQNKENLFTHIPADYDPVCDSALPFTTVYSDQDDWRIYRPASTFVFPADQGSLVSLDGITNNVVLARFENSSKLYNVMLTVQTSNPQAAYLGNSSLFNAAPPIDLAKVDGGYIGSQHKMLIRTPYGDVFTDAKRGDIFLLQGTQPKEISTPEVQQFLQEHLYVSQDNAFNGHGITGVYDSNNNRILITKLDGTKSFTLSYNFLTQSWISFHSYLPMFYVEHPTTFYAGDTTGLWIHGTDPTNYHNFFGKDEDYIIEYPVVYQFQDEIFHSVSDYSQAMRYNPDGSFIYTDDWFTAAVLTNDTQCSGLRKLNPKPKRSLKQAVSFPKYNADSIDIIYTKSNGFYNFNTVWDSVKDKGQPIWKPSSINLSIYRDLNQSNITYQKNSHNKAPLVSKNLRVRLINSNTNYRIISNLFTSESQPSYK